NVAQYVRIGEPALVVLGAIFGWTLWGLVFFARRYPYAWLWGAVGTVLAGALAFDGALLGYQFLGLREQCFLCLLVGVGLAVTLVLVAVVRRSWAMLFLGLAVWVGGFAAQGTLRIDPDVPRLEQTAFLRKEGDASTAPLRLHLFFSLHCGHCSELAANLAVNQAWQKAYWTLSATDTGMRDLRRLAHIRRESREAKNPFVVLLRVESQQSVPEGAVPEAVREASENTQRFFQYKNWRGVPVLVAREGLGKEVTLTGAESIMRYLAQKDILERRIDLQKLQKRLSEDEGS
ncbi:MAG: hypothetical protein ACQESV_05980, partial [Thermodesulfobacteriota bacterium]